MKAKMAMAAALATLVTVGGVYATWTFSEGEVANANTTVNVAMTGVSATTKKGTLEVKVMSSGGLTLAVDDSDNNHLPELKKEGDVTVIFTPSATASNDIKANGIDVQLVISYAPYAGGAATLEDWVYEGTQIFDIINDSTDPIHLDSEEAVDADGVFTWTVGADDIGIALTEAMEDIYIDTLAKYDALNEILAKGHFVLTVSECTTAHA